MINVRAIRAFYGLHLRGGSGPLIQRHSIREYYPVDALDTALFRAKVNAIWADAVARPILDGLSPERIAEFGRKIGERNTSLIENILFLIECSPVEIKFVVDYMEDGGYEVIFVGSDTAKQALEEDISIELIEQDAEADRRMNLILPPAVKSLGITTHGLLYDSELIKARLQPLAPQEQISALFRLLGGFRVVYPHPLPQIEELKRSAIYQVAEEIMQAEEAKNIAVDLFLRSYDEIGSAESDTKYLIWAGLIVLPIIDPRKEHSQFKAIADKLIQALAEENAWYGHVVAASKALLAFKNKLSSKHLGRAIALLKERIKKCQKLARSSAGGPVSGRVRIPADAVARIVYDAPAFDPSNLMDSAYLAELRAITASLEARTN